MKYISLILLSLLFSCEKERGPEEVLNKFIDYRFQGGSYKYKALDLTTGDLKKILNEIPEDKAEKFWDISGLYKSGMKINLRNCNEEKCFLTYTLKYKEKSKPGDKLEVKKIATLVKLDEKWKISDVTDVKTYIDSKELIIDDNTPTK